jgi:polyhydroxyalkanoate synthesis regulator phasin
LVKQAAAARQAHATWFNQFNTEMEKEAYAHGAEDGDAMADAIEGGADPEEMADVSDEEALEYIQALVESGQIDQEEAEAIITALGDSMQDGLTGQELADALTQAVESGEITPEQATAIAQEYMAQFEGGAEGGEEAAMAAAAEDPAVQEAAAEAAEKTAAVINHLWTPGMA